MIFPNDYVFYIKDGTDYLYVDTVTGIVSTSLTAEPLVYAPEDWREVSISFERGWNYYSLFRLYTTPFKFVKDGATILRWGYYLSLGVEKNLTLVIKKFNRLASVMDYEDFLECDIDFSTFKDNFTRVEVNLIEGGFMSKFRARENTTYELPVELNADRVWVRHDGIKLDCVITWGMLNANFPQAFTVLVLPTTFYNYTEGANIDLQAWSVDPPTFQNFFVKNPSANAITVDLHLILNIDAIMDPGNGSNGTVYVRYDLLKIAPIGFLSHNIVYTQGGLTPGSTTTINLDQIDTITIPPNHGLEFNIIVNNGMGGGASNNYQIDILDNCKLTATFSNRYGENYIPCLRSQYVYESLIGLMSDGTTTAVSDLMTNTHPDKVITSGDAIRNLASSSMKLSFSELWMSINSVFSAMFYYDKSIDTTYLEEKIEAFDEFTTIASIGDVNNAKFMPLTSEMFSKLKAGFGQYTYDEINGKDEFNQLTEFLLPLTKTTAEKDLTSKIRADMYGIENIRRNLTEKLTTDADTDNDLFWLHIESASSGTIPTGFVGAGEPYFDLYRKTIDVNPGASYWEIDNLNYPDTAYNIFFSAKRQLSRWSSYLSSLLYLLDTSYIKFQQSSKNNPGGLKLATHEGSPVVDIDESTDELVSNYLPPMFLPILVDVDFPDQATLLNAIASSPHGIIEFDYKGNTFEGFVMKITTKPKLETQNATLLLTANNTLSNIVYP